ncbi:MAG TPA: EAL domain-containing protein [Mycobacteriales bacterium]|nr:EAL domain-containing protein [Mycobacteriales bacterium]
MHQTPAWWTPVPHVRGPLTVGERPSSDRYRWLVESVQEVIFEANPEGQWTYLNPAWTRVLGYDVEATLGRPFLEYVHPDDRQANLEVFVETLSTGKEKCRFDARYVTADGDVRWMEIHAWIFRDAGGQPLGSTGTLTDVTERRLAELQLERRATHDPLTDLPNRALLDQHLVAALDRCAEGGTPLALLFLDLDRFKLVNDTLGHDAGDEVLQLVGERLRDAARPEDLVARFGGDEFVIVSERLTTAGLRSYTDRLHAALAAPMAVAGRELVLSTSIGASLVSAENAAAAVAAETLEEAANELLRDADSAMYHAKESGRDRTEVFNAVTRARIVDRFDTEHELRQAINRRELGLVYQPQIDLASGRVVGLEALVRWDHPQRGTLLPESFMAVAEESGLVVPLGRWVLVEACRAVVAAARASNRPPRIAVNLSAREISSGVVADLAGILERTGAPPSLLCLELTESALLPDADAAQAVMSDLAALGVQLSLDDFGTGFSSLAYLQRLPLRELKIDRSFVSRIHEKDGRALVAAVIRLADALGLETVAEGIEHLDQVNTLAELGCETGQGFLLGRPVRLEEALADRGALPVQRTDSSRWQRTAV